MVPNEMNREEGGELPKAEETTSLANHHTVKGCAIGLWR